MQSTVILFYKIDLENNITVKMNNVNDEDIFFTDIKISGCDINKDN